MAYISVADVRAAGLEDEAAYPDEKIESAILRQTAIVDRICRQWFEPVVKTLLLDGTDSDTLPLDFPIVAVSALYVNNSFGSPLPPDYYRVYNGRGRGPDDRTCPMIRLASSRGAFLGPSRFYRGAQNQMVVGTFGYVEEDGSTPEPIKKAMLKLVIRDLTTPLAGGAAGSSDGGGGGGLSVGPKVSETTDGHTISFAAPVISGLRMGTLGVTGDPEVDKILELYRAPVAVAVA